MTKSDAVRQLMPFKNECKTLAHNYPTPIITCGPVRGPRMDAICDSSFLCLSSRYFSPGAPLEKKKTFPNSK